MTNVSRAAEPSHIRSARLLFLYAATGSGHYSSARAIAAQLRETQPDAEILLVDPSACSALHLARRSLRIYGGLIRWMPRAWGWGYELTDNRLGYLFMRVLMRRAYAPALRRIIENLEPTVVVSFHSLLSRPAQLAAGDIPCGVVVTDLGSIHRSWVDGAFDFLAVPTARAAFRARELGTATNFIKVTGLPLGQKFQPVSPPSGDDPPSPRDIRPAVDFTVLLSGGGEGVGPLLEQARALLENTSDIAVVLVCGRNRRLQRRATNLAEHYGDRLAVFGFVDDMAALVRRVDVVAAKAGPGTIVETLACGTPLIVTGALPGQEAHNVDEVLRAGAGLEARDADALVEVCQRLRDEPHRLDQLRRGAATADLADTTGGIGAAVMQLHRQAHERTSMATRKQRRIGRRASAASVAALSLAWGGLTVGANGAAAAGIAGEAAPPASSVQYEAVRVTEDDLGTPAVEQFLAAGRYTVIVDGATSTRRPAEVAALATGGVDIANGGTGQHRGDWQRWRRADRDSRTAADITKTATPRFFVPSRRVDGFDLVYSRLHHQDIVASTALNVAADPAVSEPRRLVVVDGRNVAPNTLLAYLKAFDANCAQRHIEQAPFRSLERSPQTNY